MSLPTAHNYIFENVMEALISLEDSFLEPKVLSKQLAYTEKVLNEGIEVLSNKELAEEIQKNGKSNISLIIEKLAKLEKASQSKLSWVNQFSDYLQASINTK